MWMMVLVVALLSCTMAMAGGKPAPAGNDPWQYSQDQGAQSQQGQVGQGHGGSQSGQTGQGSQMDQGNQGDQSGQSGQGNQGGQSGQSEQGQQAGQDVSQGDVKPSKKVTDMMGEYRGHVAKKAKVRSTFRQVQETPGAEGQASQGGGQSGDEGSQAGKDSPANQNLNVALGKLEAIRPFLKNLFSRGLGGYVYWRRSLRMIVDDVTVAAQLLSSIGTDEAGKIDHLLLAAIAQVANDLRAALPAKNIEHAQLNDAAKNLVRVAWGAAEDLCEIRKAAREGQGIWKRLFPKVTMPESHIVPVVKAELEVVKAFLDAKDACRGEVDRRVWIRMHEYLVATAKSGKQVLDQIGDDFGARKSKMLDDNLERLEKDLKAVEDKTDWHIGGHQYWEQAVKDALKSFRTISENIVEILKVLP